MHPDAVSSAVEPPAPPAYAGLPGQITPLVGREREHLRAAVEADNRSLRAHLPEQLLAVETRSASHVEDPLTLRRAERLSR